MRNTLVQIAIGIVMLVIAGLFTKNQFFEQKPDLKFSLSEPIDINHTDSNVVSVQQLTLVNRGDAPAKKVLVKFNQKVLECDIRKYKNSDKYNVFNEGEAVEIEYDELSHSGEVFVIIKKTGSALSENDLKITHSTGVAEEIFSDENSAANWAFFIMLLLLFVLLLIQLRLGLRNTYNAWTLLNPYSKILASNRPFFVKKGEWTQFREEAMNSLFSRDTTFFKVENTLCYKLLNEEQNPNISNNEWAEIKEKARSKLKSLIKEELAHQFDLPKIVSFIEKGKPMSLSESEWADIVTYISKIALETKLTEAFQSFYPSYLADQLKKEKPVYLTDADWDSFRSIVGKVYVALKIEEMVKYSSLNDLGTDYKQIEGVDKEKIEWVFTSIQGAITDRKRYEILNSALRSLMTQRRKPEKPESLEENDWDEIVEYFESIAKREKEILEREKVLNEKKRKINPTIEKLTRQLKIIEDILTDPKSVNQVEDYNIPFAPGNWEILSELSEFLLKLERNGKE